MVQSMNDTDQLSGVMVLVVEDDALLAMDLEATLVEAGAVMCASADAGRGDRASGRRRFRRGGSRFRTWVVHGRRRSRAGTPTGRPVRSLYGEVAPRTGLD
jgi:hypothetical protein